ncbi:hypothetical protein G7Z17_g6267 [Cylindrodendrum hubeiense]|uniref:histidine kinase n=1 Tax=Cylindrodendrum hubeiense TaxID=595255 RepID=A0A9P5HA83_9HYPO|nr:hypothetical protein G7Z17_g6267 [Cylindrodendrum hubeiense]
MCFENQAMQYPSFDAKQGHGRVGDVVASTQSGRTTFFRVEIFGSGRCYGSESTLLQVYGALVSPMAHPRRSQDTGNVARFTRAPGLVDAVVPDAERRGTSFQGTSADVHGPQSRSALGHAVMHGLSFWNRQVFICPVPRAASIFVGELVGEMDSEFRLARCPMGGSSPRTPTPWAWQRHNAIDIKTQRLPALGCWDSVVPRSDRSMAMSSNRGQRKSFFPRADAAVLSSKHAPPPTRPQTVGPIYDPQNVDRPIGPWPLDAEKTFYPPKAEAYTPTSIPDKPAGASDRYLRAFLAKNERLRLSMLWYYTRDILNEDEFLSGLQEKAHLAQEATEWEFAVIGILDVNFYIRLATVGLQLAILPRGETICAHTVTQPPGSVFHMPDMMEDWRFKESPYVELGGLQAYAGAPLRLQHESGDCVGLGSLCVASSTSQEPLNKLQQQTIARLADWVVSDLVQCARARRQRERRRMTELISTAQKEMDNAASEDTVLKILRTIYPHANVSLQSKNPVHVEIDGRSPVLLSEFEDGLWEDIDHLDDFIAHSNHRDLPANRVVRVIATQCESISGLSLLVVASKDFRLVFDDVDSWFVQTCADMLSQMWQKLLLAEAMIAKEKFLRGISHQLRTPIHGILGSVELLAEELKSWKLRGNALPVSEFLEAIPAVNAEEPSVYLNTIKTAGRDLISIVNSMITLNRWADIAMADRCYATHTVHELEAELVNEILNAISGDTRYNPSIIFNHDLPPDCDSIRVDLPLLRDTLLPLLINAIQNTSEGIVMITISIHPNWKELTIDVEDTGRGIHPDYQQRIFEPYEKVSTHSTGAGLGLAVASKFATLLHGGPFSTSTMNSALEEADRLLSEIKASRVQLLQPATPPPTPPETDEGPMTNGVVESMPVPLRLNGWPAQSPTDNSVDRDFDAIVSPAPEPEPEAPVQPIPRSVITNFSAFISSPRPTSLLVDDNVVNLRILQMYCRKRGLPYSCATDGSQAVEMFSKHQSMFAAGEGAAIQLIFMDLQMPVCDGIEATRQIRLLEKQNNWRECALFIVTGQDSLTDRTDAEDAGADDYFVKPVSIKVLDCGVKRYFPAFEAT